MSQSANVIGIDLGTSNCAVSSVALSEGPKASVVDFPVLQLQRIGEAGSAKVLPSCLYLPGEHDFPEGGARLPWGDQKELIIGELARWQGARVPNRLVASAKSWLCHSGVDRSAPILPWGAGEEIEKLSPVEASSHLLRHIIAAWNHAHPATPLESQEVIITVPASFDEVARGLTVNAVRRAGIEHFTLVEEPQAAFYNFTAGQRDNLAGALAGTRLVLVADVGGGTSDFTLIQVGVSPEGPVLRRIAVGDHLMLGGDNMDAALAHRAEQKMTGGHRKLTHNQWNQLVQAVRRAKETLLSAEGPESHNLSIVSEGKRLFGGTLSAQLTREEVEELVLDGFFPECAPNEPIQRASQMGLQQVGLPYAQDPAITRQLANFIQRHISAGWSALGEEVETGSAEACPPLPRPDAILFNGGVFNSQKIRERLVGVVSQWWPDQPAIPTLHHDSLELAVARGAAYYGLVRHGMGRRIGGGSAHAFYVALGQVSDNEAPQGLCVIPRGHEEGETIDLGERTFHLTLNQPVQFPLFSSTADRVDAPGAVVPLTDDMHPLPPIHTLLRRKSTSGEQSQQRIPVHLRAGLTEIGTLELWCVSDDTNEQWRLEFGIRGSSSKGSFAVTEAMPKAFEQAREWINLIFGHKPLPITAFKGVKGHKKPGQPPKEVKQLWSNLERHLGPRAKWGLPVLRELWSVLFAGAPKRRRSADHERIFYQLAGYSLRPGFGYPLDDWRCDQTFEFFTEGVTYHKEKPVWNEFWILWRRIAGGLDKEKQQRIWKYLKPHLAVRVPPEPKKSSSKAKGIQPEGLDEMVRAAAVLEHLSPREKTELGEWILERLKDSGLSSGGPWAWALGRIGARVPIYGSQHQVVSPQIVARWLFTLAELDVQRIEGAPFAITQMARMTGDRSRDVDETSKQLALDALQVMGGATTWSRMVSEPVAMETADEARALGDTLPVGLQLQ